MMRDLSRIFVLSAAIAALTGCSDSIGPAYVADGGEFAHAADRPSLVYSGPYRFSGYKTSYIVLTASGGNYDIGDGLYTLTVPGNAVCALGSSYGPTEWDAPCRTLGESESILVRAVVGFANGGPVVDFSPNLRFSPKAEVVLSTSIYAPMLVPMRGYYTANPWALRWFGIYYTPNLGLSGETDAAFDPSLATYVNLRTGVVSRRVKHFSGYNILVGMPCDPSPDDPDCVEVPEPIIQQ